RHRGSGLGGGTDRVRGHHRAAHDPAVGGDELPVDPATLGALRRCLPYLLRPGGAHRPGARGGADRRRDRDRRRPVLHRRASYREAGDRMNDEAAVVARGVRVRLGGVEVLHGVDLTVAAGEWLTVIGPNGAGKSTLLRAVGGLVRFAGSVEVFGTPIGARSRRARARLVATVPQN